MRLSEATEAFLQTKEQEGYSKHTLNVRRVHLSLFIKEIGDLEIEDVTLAILRSYFSQLEGIKASTMGQKIRAVKVLFNWLVEEEYTSHNPALKLKEPKLDKLVPKALTIEEVELLRDSCKTVQEHAMIEFFFATGCRISEVQQLNRNSIDWNRKAVTVFGKGRKEREVYFGAKAAIWLKRYLAKRKDTDMALFVTDQNPHNRISVHQIQYIFKRVAKRCGLEERVTPHVLRHTFATFLINQGAPLHAVQTLCGHDRPETTMRYLNLSGESRAQAYRRYFVQ